MPCRQHALETLGSQPAATEEPAVKKRKSVKDKAASAPVVAAAVPHALAVTVESGSKLGADVGATTVEVQPPDRSGEVAAEAYIQDAGTRQRRRVHWADDTPADAGTLPQVGRWVLIHVIPHSQYFTCSACAFDTQSVFIPDDNLGLTKAHS